MTTVHRRRGATAASSTAVGPVVRTRRVALRAAPLVIAATAGALVALASAYLVWPHGTVNLDEVVYLNQAEAIRHGSLTYDADAYLPDFRPYLSGVHGDQVVFKYQPLWPALLAASEAATGDHRIGLVATGAATALAMWFLGREVTGSPWLGTGTAVAVAVSPLFVAHSGSVLAYLPSAGLVAASVAAALRAGRTWARRWSLAAGAGFGALFFHRPYDAVLAAIPVGAWLAWRAGRQRRWPPLLAVVVGAVPFVVLWLAYNQHVTGDAVQPAFSVGAPEDRFGFGLRASWAPADPEFARQFVDFTPGRSLHTVGRFAAISPLWVAGGVVFLALAVVAVAARRHDGRRWVLVATAGTVIVGHGLWWGTQNFVDYGLDGVLGPAYWLAALGPVTALAAAGGRDLVAHARGLAPVRRRALLAGVTGVALVGSIAGAAVVGVDIDRAARSRERQVAIVEAAPEGSVLIVPGPADDPFVRAVVPADLDGAPRLVAVAETTAAQPFRLRDRFGDRALWAWLPHRPAGSLFAAATGYELGALPEMAGPQADVRIALADGEVARGDAWLRLVDADDVEIARIDVGVLAGAARGVAAPATSVPAVGAAGAGGTLAIGPEPCWLAAGVTVERPGGPLETVEVRWAVRARGGRVEVIGAGVGHRYYEFPGAAGWFAEDVTGSVSARVEGLARFDPVQDAARLL